MLTSGTKPTRKKTWRCAKSCWHSEDDAQNLRSTLLTSAFPPGIRIAILAGLIASQAALSIAAGACLLPLLLFVFETVVVIQNWRFIGPDTALFFNFAQKSFADFARVLAFDPGDRLHT